MYLLVFLLFLEKLFFETKNDCDLSFVKASLNILSTQLFTFYTFVTPVDSLNFLHSDEKDRKW